MADRPRLVEEANRLKGLHQAGKEEECVESALACYYGISEIMVAAEDRKDSRLITFAAMHIAVLAERLGWLEDDRLQKESRK